MEQYTWQQSLIVVGAVYFLFFALWSWKSGKPNWVFQGKRFVIDWEYIWLVITFAVVAMALDNFGKPVGMFLLLAVLIFFIAALFLEWRRQRADRKLNQNENNCNKKKEENIRKVLYNLTIGIECGAEIRKTSLHSKEDEIERLGLAIHRAKKMLVGNWQVLEGGYLVRGFSVAEGVKKQATVIDIDESSPALQLLEKVLAKKVKMTETSCRVCMHLENGWPVYVDVNENGLRIH